MGFLYLFISIFGESAGNTIEKLNFARNHITARQDMFLGFLWMYLSVLVFILIDKQRFPHFSLASLGILVLIAAFSFGGNVFDCLSVKANDLSLREPLVDFEPIVAGLAAYVVFPSERKPAFLVAFALGALIVRWGIHRRKLRKHQKKGCSIYGLPCSCTPFYLHYTKKPYFICPPSISLSSAWVPFCFSPPSFSQ
jgi:hypothetical protein